MYNVMDALRGCRAVKFDSCKNLPSSVHRPCNHSAVCQIGYKDENIVYYFCCVVFYSDWQEKTSFLALICSKSYHLCVLSNNIYHMTIRTVYKHVCKWF